MFVGFVEGRKQFKRDGAGSMEDFKDLSPDLSVEYGLEEIFEFYNSKIKVNTVWTKENVGEFKKLGWDEIYKFDNGILRAIVGKGAKKNIFSRKTKTVVSLLFLGGPLKDITCYCFFEGNKLKIGSYRDFAIFQWLQKKGVFAKLLED